MHRTRPFTAEREPHTVRCLRARAVDGLRVAFSGCTARRADGVPAFLS